MAVCCSRCSQKQYLQCYFAGGGETKQTLRRISAKHAKAPCRRFVWVAHNKCVLAEECQQQPKPLVPVDCSTSISSTVPLKVTPTYFYAVEQKTWAHLSENERLINWQAPAANLHLNMRVRLFIYLFHGLFLGWRTMGWIEHTGGVICRVTLLWRGGYRAGPGFHWMAFDVFRSEACQ